jgi:structural maintenance of chromosome 1
MDAISFVLGIQSKYLRSSQLKDLVFRKDLNSQPAKKAIVRLIYQTSNGELSNKPKHDILFSRSISNSGVTNYQVDGKDVTFENYEKTLSSIGVLVQARNFLVFQGDIESVAQKSPLELTTLVEQISGYKFKNCFKLY